MVINSYGDPQLGLKYINNRKAACHDDYNIMVSASK